jgi:hypothetical protein
MQGSGKGRMLRRVAASAWRRRPRGQAPCSEHAHWAVALRSKWEEVEWGRRGLDWQVLGRGGADEEASRAELNEWASLIRMLDPSIYTQLVLVTWTSFVVDGLWRIAKQRVLLTYLIYRKSLTFVPYPQNQLSSILQLLNPFVLGPSAVFSDAVVGPT